MDPAPTSRPAAVAGSPAALPLAARRHAVVTEVGRRLAGSCGMESGGRLVVAVSGGADSVALLLATTVLGTRDAWAGEDDGERPRAVAPIEPIAVHVHHHLRPGEADDDAAFVAELCARLDVELRIDHIQPAVLSGNLADNARTLRYRALAENAAAVGATHIAVGHHADDQLETVLMALCRGAGLDGLSGMAWARPLDDALTIARPLLGVEAAECEDLCRCAGVAWREDSANTDARLARARLRRDVIPVLESLWPGAAGRCATATELIAASSAALEREIAGAFGAPGERRWPRARLAPLAPVVIAAGLRRAAVDAAPACADALGRRLLLPPAGIIATGTRRPRAYDWPGGLRLAVTAHEVILSSRESQ